MNYLVKYFVGIFLLSFAYAQECPCSLEQSTKYPGTFKWDCQDHGLLAVPTQCYDEQSQNITELLLTNNIIQSIEADDFVGLSDLKSLHLDINEIESFDQNALDQLKDLQIFNIAQNPNLQFPSTALSNISNFEELDFISSHIGSLPDVSSSYYLKILDARSCQLTTVPRPLFGSLDQCDFYLNFVGNEFVDIAADILLPIADYSTINLDSYVTIWAKDEMELYTVLDKNWNINLDLDVSLKVCDYDGNPEDPSMC